MLVEKWEKAEIIPEKFLEIGWWMMYSKEWFGVEEEDLEKLRMKILGSRNQEYDYRKIQIRARDR